MSAAATAPAALPGRGARLRQAWAARAPREQALVIAAAAALSWAAADLLAWQPAEARRTLALKQVAALQAERDALAGQVAAAAEQVREFDRQEQAWRQRLAQAEARRQALRGAITPPAEMLARLRELSGLGSRVTLLSLAALPAERIDAAPDAGAAPVSTPVSPPAAVAALPTAAGTAPAAASPRALYRLPVQVTVEGDWNALHDYLTRLEAAAPGVRWQQIELRAAAWPATRLTLRVFTLAEHGHWVL